MSTKKQNAGEIFEKSGDTYVNRFKTKKEFRQFNRSGNIKIAAMYAMYLSGKSLEEVGRVYHVTRQAVFGVFQARGYPLRSKKKYPELVLDGIKFTPSLRGGYWRATSRTKNIFLHTYVWQKHHGPVVAGCGIHHRDGDRSNNSIENLEMLPIAEISRRFSNPLGLNQYVKK